jgi:hypothetical protein
LTGPPRIDSESVGVVTVNEAVAVALEVTSVAVTVLAPVGAVAGTAKVQVNAPVALVVIVPALEVPTVHELNEAIAIDPNLRVTGPLWLKPVPVTTMFVPIGPPRGDSEIVGVVAVNAADLMKFVAPCEMSTNAFGAPGAVIVVPEGIAPAAVEVNAVPLAQAVVPVAVKQAVYDVLGA